MIDLNKQLEWNSNVPTKEGVYYVLGQGLTGVQQRYLSKKGFILKDGEQPLVYGTLKDLSGGYKSVYVTESKISKEDLQRLHYEADSAYELHADADMFALVLVRGGTRHVVWSRPDEVLKNNVADDFYDIAMTGEPVYGMGGDSIEPAPKKEEPKPESIAEPAKEEAPIQEEVEEPAQETVETPAEAPAQAPAQNAGDDLYDIDDLPF